MTRPSDFALWSHSSHCHTRISIRSLVDHAMIAPPLSDTSQVPNPGSMIRVPKLYVRGAAIIPLKTDFHDAQRTPRPLSLISAS